MKSLGSRPKGARLERMKGSPRWAGEGFRNLHPVMPGLRDPAAAMPTVKEFLCDEGRRVPSAPLPAMNPLEAWRRKSQSGLRATWLGHSTVLIEIGGVRILTDPVWGPRASPLALAGPKRFQLVPVTLREMPVVDVVVRPERITELDWWESHELSASGVRLTAAPSQHFSGRTFGVRNPTLWSSFVMRSADHGVFFSGDTGLTTEYEDIRARLGPFDLVMLEIGAFHPAWGDVHLGPENALKAHSLLGGGAFLPVHWATFSLAMHAWDQPAEVLLEHGSKTGARLLMPRLGQPVEPSLIDGRVEPWWRAVDSVAAATGRETAEGKLPSVVPWPLD